MLNCPECKQPWPQPKNIFGPPPTHFYYSPRGDATRTRRAFEAEAHRPGSKKEAEDLIRNFNRNNPTFRYSLIA